MCVCAACRQNVIYNKKKHYAATVAAVAAEWKESKNGKERKEKKNKTTTK